MCHQPTFGSLFLYEAIKALNIVLHKKYNISLEEDLDYQNVDEGKVLVAARDISKVIAPDLSEQLDVLVGMAERQHEDVSFVVVRSVSTFLLYLKGIKWIFSDATAYYVSKGEKGYSIVINARGDSKVRTIVKQIEIEEKKHIKDDESRSCFRITKEPEYANNASTTICSNVKLSHLLIDIAAAVGLFNETQYRELTEFVNSC